MFWNSSLDLSLRHLRGLNRRSCNGEGLSEKIEWHISGGFERSFVRGLITRGSNPHGTARRHNANRRKSASTNIPLPKIMHLIVNSVAPVKLQFHPSGRQYVHLSRNKFYILICYYHCDSVMAVKSLECHVFSFTPTCLLTNYFVIQGSVHRYEGASRSIDYHNA